ncbi:FmdB family zinc ribbon protein [Cerasicoccus arenae]|nr:zinc ribbon domain-containing protein [Cerasicoccus arenae]MBK1859437.1 zinc ribbon domain-containing protein [Cerasicoccus arenae]
MPIYEYHCPDCKHDVELLVRSSSETPKCPDCGGDHLAKQFSTFAAGGAPTGGDSCAHTGGCGCAHGGMPAGGSCGLN